MILYLDTNIVIYAVEMNPVWVTKALSRIAGARAVGDTFMVSDLTRMECLVGPLRARNTVVESHYLAFWSSPDVRVVAVNPAVCDRAARIRAATRFKALDALQLAAAVEHGANVFLTNDVRLGTFTGLPVEILT